MSMGVTVVIVITLAVTMIVMRVIVATVFVIAMIVVTVIMAVVIMMIMTMRGMAAAGIGAAFRIERRFDGDDARTKTAHHVLNDVIAADAKALADDLRRQVPVAEMPGDPHEMMRIGAANFHQRLRRRDHLDQPPVFQHQRIAAAQRDGFLQVQQELQPARTGHHHPPPVPVVETEDHRVSGGLGPANLRANLRCADHEVSFCTSPPIMTSMLVGDALNGPDSARHAFKCGMRR